MLFPLLSRFHLIVTWMHLLLKPCFQLEPYMDECFILQAFDQMGEPAMQVKLINNKQTGYV